MRDPPVISVVIPTRHRNDLLAKCLACLLPGVQTLAADAYEVIVTDDGSVGSAETMIRDQFPWVRWVAGPRRGPAANRNAGARAAIGTWIAFTDDDCLPDATWLAAMSEAFRPDVRVYEGKTTCAVGVDSPMMYSPLNLTGGYLWSCNVIIERALFREMCGFEERYRFPHMEDVDFRERLRERQLPFQFVSNAIVDHPPRPIVAATARARNQISEGIFRRLHGKADPSLPLVLYRIARERKRNIVAHRFSIDSVRAAASATVELVIILFRYNAWLRKLNGTRGLTTKRCLST